MEKAKVVTLIITLFTGFSLEQDLLPTGPIYEEVGASVLFTTIASSQPIRAIRWNFNGSEVIRFNHPGSEIVDPKYKGRVRLNYSTGELELKGLTMADSGEYALTLTFENGLGYQDHILLLVFERVFTFGIIGPDGNLIEHSNATFTCEGNGSIHNIVWMKEDEILVPTSSITFLDDNRTMLISPVRRSDSGIYRCAMSNPVSNSTSHYSITVYYGPDVRILGAQTLEQGSDIVLLCAPDSVPPATVTWTVKGMSAGNAPLYVTENIKPSDSGNYNCTCWNNVTGLTAFAVQVVTVRAVSSRLSRGAEAGITLGVLFAVVILAALSYFLINHHRKHTDTVNEAPSPMVANQQTDQISEHNYEEAGPPLNSTNFRKYTQDEMPMQHLPPNNQSTPPRSIGPPLPPNRT